MRVLSNSKNHWPTELQGGKLLGHSVPLFRLKQKEEDAPTHRKISNLGRQTIKVTGSGYQLEIQGQGELVVSAAEFEAMKTALGLEEMVKAGLRFENCNKNGN